ncbi:branched-chain amino acid ABC transporter permease [Acrocarpospora pleiomorpha]|uniref:Branched-chain amino acid ABC transporter permease n=1 Tax=Acrocarpospora pleiomorpha TaxID=90975 RepID=A0A5M3X6F5_9ACTN|nr:ATP-binding cassette domain-containing protein [Acrocarpospora pleiomorpha]GES17267.1 branched-chain amino acid ABC transporter permease [Acrocarpospora pleiomorpha]
MKIRGVDVTLTRYMWIAPLVVGLFVMAGPYWGAGHSFMRQVLLISIMALVVSGLNLAWGFGGELAIGQVAMYAAGAYLTGWMSIQGYDMAISLVASLVFVAALGLITALPGLRITGWGLAMCSFFLVALIPETTDLLDEYTGGTSGLLGIAGPVLFGQPLGADGFYVLTVGCLILWLALMRNLVLGRHGSALRVMRESPVLAKSLGYSVTRLKATAYVVGALPAGVAGWLYAYLDRFVTPDYFNFMFAITVLAAAVLGGAETVYGVIAGVAILQLGPNQIEAFEEYTFVVYGAFLIAGGVLLTSDRYRRLVRTVKRRLGLIQSTVIAKSIAEVGDVPPVPGKRVLVEDIVMSFGGVRALDGVTIEAAPGQITGLIGANGSGKTTMLNIVSGYYGADSGRVVLGDDALPPRRPEAAALMGVARTFQTPVVPRSMTVAEVVSSARYRRHYTGVLPAMLRLPNYRRSVIEDNEATTRWLSAVGLLPVADADASGVPLGTRRLIEVARALCTDASVLLLDEPASGLGAAEVDELSDLLRALRDAGATIILVEHNFEMICAVADRIYVLERGRLIADGTAHEIRDDEAVARSYLGSVDPTEVVQALAAPRAAATTGERTD